MECDDLGPDVKGGDIDGPWTSDPWAKLFQRRPLEGRST